MVAMHEIGVCQFRYPSIDPLLLGTKKPASEGGF